MITRPFGGEFKYNKTTTLIVSESEKPDSCKGCHFSKGRTHPDECFNSDWNTTGACSTSYTTDKRDRIFILKPKEHAEKKPVKKKPEAVKANTNTKG